MIPWYKRWYLVDEIETETVLENELVLIKMNQYFDPDRPSHNQYGKRQRKPKCEFNYNKRTGHFSLSEEPQFRWNDRTEGRSFVAYGSIEATEKGSLIKLHASVPIILILIGLVFLAIIQNYNTYLFLALLLPIGIGYFVVRKSIKEKLLDMDIEIHKCLKS